MSKKDLQKNSIIIYKTAKGPELEVRFKEETVWLSLDQMAELFGRAGAFNRHQRPQRQRSDDKNNN